MKVINSFWHIFSDFYHFFTDVKQEFLPVKLKVRKNVFLGPNTQFWKVAFQMLLHVGLNNTPFFPVVGVPTKIISSSLKTQEQSQKFFWTATLVLLYIETFKVTNINRIGNPWSEEDGSCSFNNCIKSFVIAVCFSFNLLF